MQTSSPRRTPGGTVDVQSLIDAHPFTAAQWLVFALCFVVVLLDGFDTAAIGYLAPSLIKEWGVTKPMLGPVLSAALFGLCAGSLSSGPLADRFGRRLVLIFSVGVFGVACLASSFAGQLDTLATLRFVTGLGLGAAMPNAITLMNEFCPTRRRATMTNLMFCGFPLGAALGGFLAAWMIPQWGWRSVLVLGGAAPLVLTALLLTLLPESVRFLVARARPSEQVRAVLRRIVGPAADAAGQFVMTELRPSTTQRGGIAQALAPGYRLGSLMLWLTYFMGLVIFYALINWMPLLFKEAGIDPKTATLISALFPLGGVGAVGAGWLMDRFDSDRIVAAFYALTAVSIWAIGQVVGQVGLLMAVVFVAGVFMNTGQSSMGSLAASFYPTSARASGVSWMLGIGRFGGIAGSFLVAQLTAMHMDIGGVFATLAVAGLIAAGALWIKRGADPAPRGAAKPAAAREGYSH